MDLGLKGKIGIVTGASGGIGAAIAQELSAEGCRLMLVARASDALDRQTEHCGADVAACAVDLTDLAAADAVVKATQARFGGIDFVVCAAGGAKMGEFQNLTDDDWQNGFALKFMGHMRLVRSAWASLKQSAGSVIFIVGAAGRTPFATSAITGAVNAALLNLTKTLAVCGMQDGIKVNAINPGPIRTERFEGRIAVRVKERGVSAGEAETQLLSESGAYRIGEPKDVAALVAFVASSRGHYIHGALIDIDGGKTRTL